jgi:hypothetical protein
MIWRNAEESVRGEVESSVAQEHDEQRSNETLHSVRESHCPQYREKRSEGGEGKGAGIHQKSVDEPSRSPGALSGLDDECVRDEGTQGYP